MKTDLKTASIRMYNLAIAALLTTIAFAACVASGTLSPTQAAISLSAQASHNATTQAAALTTSNASATAKVVQQQAVSVDAAKGIAGDVATGRKLTPADGVSALSPVWDSLATRAKAIFDQSGVLADVAAQLKTQDQLIAGVRDNVAALSYANQTLAADATAAQKAADAATAEAKKASSQTAHMTALLVVLAIAAAGAGVVLAFWVKSAKLGISCIAGAVTIMVLASLFGQIGAAMVTLTHVATIALGIGAALYVGDVLWRHFKDKAAWKDALAFAANPLDDVKDILATIAPAVKA